MILNRVNPMGLTFQLLPQGRETTTVVLIGKSNKKITVNASIEDMSQWWYNWQMKGQNIQVAFASLNAEEREFLMTGITPSEWKEIFKDGED